MVVASLALFIALGGAGYAATTLPKDSVGTAQIQTEAVHIIVIAEGGGTVQCPGAGQAAAGYMCV